MNTTLNSNITSLTQTYPAVASKPIRLPGLPGWIRIIAHFFVTEDDPAAIRYVQNKYTENWD